MIKRLKLKNFKKHAELDITLTDGLNGVFGGNYRGKSTILHGILFCLGGASAVPGTNLQRNGTNTGFKQEMWLTIGGKDYYIVRTKTQARLFLGEGEEGELIAAGTSPVNEEVSNLIGMSMKRFQQLRYASQKKTDAMLTLGAGELHKIIEELSGADKIDSALGKLKDMVTFETGKIEGMCEVDEKAIEAEASCTEVKLVDLGQEEATLSKRCSLLNDELYQTQKQVAEVEKVVKENERLQRLIDREEWELRQCEKQLAELLEQRESIRVWDESEVDSITAETNRLSGVLQQLQNAGSEVQDTARVLDRAEKSLKEESEIEMYIPSFDPDKLSEAEETYSTCQGRSDDLKGQVEDLRNAIDGGACKSCGRPYEGIDVPSLTDRLKSVQGLLNGSLEELADAHNQVKRLAADEKEYDRAHAACAAHDRSIERLRKVQEEATLAACKAETNYLSLCKEHGDPEEVKAAYDRVRDQYQSYVSDTKELNKILTSQESIEAEFKYATGKLKTLKADLLEVDGSVLEALRPKLSSISEDLTNIRVKLAEVRGELNQEDARLVMLTHKLENARKSNAMIHAAKAKLNGCKALQKYLRENRDRYMSDVWAGFMAQASEFASACTGGAIEGLVRTEDGRFRFIENGFDMEVKAASGAQSSIMGLGVQMALADATACPMDVILVDEPTADMDPEHSMATAAMLAANGRQVICVSHSQMDSSVCNNVITIGE